MGLACLGTILQASILAQGFVPRRPPRFGDGDNEQFLANDLFPQPDRNVRQWMTTAERLVAEERYAEAARFLQRILDTGEDFFVPGEENVLRRSFKGEALRLLGNFPEDGRKAYRLNYAADAQKLLDDALKNHRSEGLEEIVRRFFHTPAGYQATYLLGCHYLDQHQPLVAALLFQRLKDSPAAAAFEPHLSLQLATSWYQAGVSAQAEAVLIALRKSHPAARFSLNGRNVPLFAQDSQALAWLASVGKVGHLALADKGDDWLLFRGSPTRVQQNNGGRPLLDRRWSIPVSNDARVHRQVLDMERSFHERKLAAIPTLHPLVVKNVVLVRTVNSILAVDFRTGRRLWHVEESGADFLNRAAGTGRSPFEPDAATAAAMSLEQRLWNDLAYGMLSSDGQTVYVVHGQEFAAPTSRRGRAVLINGQMVYDSGEGRNRLLALDLPTQGKTKWEIGGVETDPQSPLAGARFLGPPLPLAGQLYVIASIRGEIRLLALEAQSGAYQWSQQLAVADQLNDFGIVARLSGVSPSFADGMLICPFSAGGVVAIDLATRSLRWGYRHPIEQPGLPNRIEVIQNEMQDVRSSLRDAWADSVATIAGGRVLLTPDTSNQLHCLSLIDGTVQWQAPRSGGLYLACVHDGKVVVVGSQQVTAWKLDSGLPAGSAAQLAWGQPIKLPEGSLPSGRGFHSGRHYYLPLSDARIAILDLDRGEIEDFVKSRTGVVPGNLICYQDSIISQRGGDIDCFYQLQPLESRIQAALAGNVKDSEALMYQGQILLERGQPQEAVERLRRSLELVPDPHTQELLVEGTLELLRSDFTAHRGLLAELDRLVERHDHRIEYLRLKGSGLLAAGERLAAFESYLELAGLASTSQELEPMEPNLRVRSDRSLRALLATVFKASSPQEQLAMDDRIRSRFDRARQAEGHHDLRRFIALFGDYPLAAAARRELAQRAMNDGAALEAEILLRKLAQSEPPEMAAWAVAQLAQLLAQSGQPSQAATYYARLATDFADVKCLADKTGRQLAAEAPADVQTWLANHVKPPLWPAGAVEVSREPMLNNIYRAFPIPWEGAAPNGSHELYWDTQTFSVFARDSLGRKLWSAQVAEPGGTPFYISPMVTRAKGHGHFVLVSLGYELVALDTLGDNGNPKILWRHNALQSLPGVAGQTNFGMRTRMVRQPWGEQRYFATDNAGRAVGGLGPVTDRYACFQRGNEVIAVDLLSGEPLWQRQGLPAGSRLVGDDELVFVIPPDGGTATVLSADDGRVVGKRSLPRDDQIIAAFGRHLITWNLLPGKIAVRREDAWKEQDGIDWSREFAAGSRVCLLGRETLGVLEPDGHFFAIDLLSGKVEIDGNIGPQPNAVEIYILRSSDRLLLVVSAGNRSNPAQGAIIAVPGGLNNPAMSSAQVFGFDRATGKQVWATPVQNQALTMDQPSDLPLLVFACHISTRLANQNESRYSVLCLDKRTGRVVFQPEPVKGAIGNFAVTGDPSQAIVKLDLGREMLTFKFTDKPWPAAPEPNQNQPHEQPGGLPPKENPQP